MPLNDFYTFRIIDANASVVLAEISINPKHPVFDGHFPNQPVTPGVILLEIARSILSKHTGKSAMLISAKEIKYMSPIIPAKDTLINLKIDFERIDNNIKASCVFSSEEKVFTKLKGVFSGE
jgi:3-hydroxyacyl-[acyl-carrier-protein] dehydratase